MSKEWKLNSTEEMLFALLRTSLNGQLANDDICHLTQRTDEDWTDCMNMAYESGVIALACHGMTLLPKEEMWPSTDIRLECLRKLYEAHGRYALYCDTIERLERLFHSHGIGMMVIKGVGASAYYPLPALRKCGDIDIYTYALDPTRMSDEEASTMADKVIEDFGLDVNRSHYKHSSFTYNNVDIESHKCFLDIKEIKEAEEIDKLLHQLRNTERVKMGEKYEVTVPSPEFHALFIAFHASQHFGNKMTIYHLCDWACILKKHGWLIPKEVKAEGFIRFAQCLTSLSNKLLGTDVEVDYDPKLEAILLKDMLTSGSRNREQPKNLGKWIAYKIQHKMYEMNVQRNIYHVDLWMTLKNGWTSLCGRLNHDFQKLRY